MFIMFRRDINRFAELARFIASRSAQSGSRVQRNDQKELDRLPQGFGCHTTPESTSLHFWRRIRNSTARPKIRMTSARHRLTSALTVPALPKCSFASGWSSVALFRASSLGARTGSRRIAAACSRLRVLFLATRRFRGAMFRPRCGGGMGSFVRSSHSGRLTEIRPAVRSGQRAQSSSEILLRASRIWVKASGWSFRKSSKCALRRRHRRKGKKIETLGSLTTSEASKEQR